MITQVTGDMLLTITKINSLRRVIAMLESFDQDTITAIYQLTMAQYDDTYSTIADKYDTLTKETLQTLHERLSTLEKSLIIDRNALMSSPVYHRTVEEHRTRFYYWLRQATKAYHAPYGMGNPEHIKRLMRIARKAESLYRKAEKTAAL